MAGSLESRRLVILSVKSNVFIGLTGTQHRYRLHTTKLRPIQPIWRLSGFETSKRLLWGKSLRLIIKKSKIYLKNIYPRILQVPKFLHNMKMPNLANYIILSLTKSKCRLTKGSMRWPRGNRCPRVGSAIKDDKVSYHLQCLERVYSDCFGITLTIILFQLSQGRFMYCHKSCYKVPAFTIYYIFIDETGVTKTFKIFCIWYKNTKSLRSIPTPLIRQAACFGNDQL
ncbi:unnamed protein product [Nesidiocoris tenuis]|uniref:Uncharacterized protein n=1 Tax=Nesidiocoris tenuis TaxID=355587 RepID=A0A6H5HIA2_9HEMI|nr:unnamed protein product [Nesidiocoris tenuis]